MTTCGRRAIEAHRRFGRRIQERLSTPIVLVPSPWDFGWDALVAIGIGLTPASSVFPDEPMGLLEQYPGVWNECRALAVLDLPL
jgi:hypothetical protein